MRILNRGAARSSRVESNPNSLGSKRFGIFQRALSARGRPDLQKTRKVGDWYLLKETPMVAMATLFALIIAIALPVLSAKGRGWRGLWFGLSIPALLLAIFFGSQRVLTFEQTRLASGNPNLTREEYESMNGMDPAAAALAAGAFLGCLIAGCHRLKWSPIFCLVF